MGSHRGGRRAWAVGFAVAAVLVLVGGLLVWLGGRDSLAPGPAAGDTEEAAGSGDTPATRTSTVGGGTGFARDEPGAAAAAVAYTAASQDWLYLADDDVAAAVAAIAAPGSAERLAAEVVEETGTARDQLAEAEGRVWWWVHPLAWRTVTHSEESASVEVWTVTVLSATGVAVPQSEWMTVTVDLEWVEGIWRVAAIRDRPGPTPTTGPRDDPWDAAAFDDALAGFTRLGGEQTP